MRIFCISHSAVIEAYQEKYEFLANEFNNEVVLVTQKKRSEGGGNIVEAKDRKVAKLEVKVLGSIFSNSLRRHRYFSLSSLVCKFQPDIIYAENEPQAESTLQAYKLADKLGAKFSFFTWENIEQIYTGRKKKIEEVILKNSDAAISGNSEGKQILQSQKFTKPIAVIPQYGVSPDIFKPIDVSGWREKLGTKDKFVLGYIGRLLPEKNIASILQTLKQLPGEIVLLIIGSGPEEDELKAQVEKLNLKDRVEFIRAVAHEEVPQYMNLFDLLVLPSITTKSWKEQFGRVLPEAMACKTLAIGSDSGEIPNVIGDPELIFPEGNIGSMTKIINRIFTDVSFREEKTKASYDRTIKLFTNKGIAAQMNKFFNQIK